MTIPKMRTVAHVTVTAVAAGWFWLVVSLALLVALTMAVSMTPFVIVSGSMQPTIARGDIVVTVDHPDDGTLLGPPSVITSPHPGNGQLVTHRIVGWDRHAQGYLTRGDANQHNDAQPVAPADVVGTARLLIPKVGLPAVWVGEGDHWRALLAISTVLAAAFIAFRTPTVAPDAPAGSTAAAASSEQERTPDRPGRAGRRRPATVALTLTVAFATVAATAGSAAGYHDHTRSGVTLTAATPDPQPATTTWTLHNELAGQTDTAAYQRMPLIGGPVDLPHLPTPNYSTDRHTGPGRLLTATGNDQAVWTTPPAAAGQHLNGTATITLYAQRFAAGGGFATLHARLVAVDPAGGESELASGTGRTAANNPQGGGEVEQVTIDLPVGSAALPADHQLELRVTVTGRDVRLRYATADEPARLILPSPLTAGSWWAHPGR